MEINFSTTAKSNAVIQGVDIVLSTEFKGNETPRFINAVCSGYMEQGEQGTTSMHTNANLKYDVETKDFADIHGSNVSQSLIKSIVPLIEEFNTVILAERGGEQ